MIAAVPHEGVAREQALRDVTEVMRIRHGLRLDEPNDFDLITQDAALRLWDQVSSATFLALVAISSIALLVGGIGVMAIMTISVKERTREIGTRKAIGARRREILWQFLLEAVFLTAIGGVLGILFGSGIGLGVHYATEFPVSLPWWSFAIGIGFSATVGIVFGIVPAVRAPDSIRSRRCATSRRVHLSRPASRGTITGSIRGSSKRSARIAFPTQP